MTRLEDLITLWENNSFPQTSLMICADPEHALDIVKQFANYVLSQDTKVSLENNPDFQIVQKISNEDEAKKEISVDQIRKAQEFMNKTPAISNSKILVIFQADLLNINAANASLKMLEEPGVDTYIFLITHYQNSVLPTIKSRCAIFDLAAHNKVINANYDLLLPKNTDELFKFASDIALKKNLESWQYYNIEALELMSRMIKIASGILTDDLPSQFAFREYSPHYLIHQYNKLKQIIEDTDIYELDKKQSAIMIYEIVHFIS